MTENTAPIPPTPDEPTPQGAEEPRGSRAARARAVLTRSRAGVPLLVGAGGVMVGAVIALGVGAAADDTVDASFTSGQTAAYGMPGDGHRHGFGGDRDGDQDGDLDGDGRGFGGPQETPLTGEVAEQVEAAVLEEYPDAQIIRLEQEAEGVYEAHLVSDGTMITVHLDEDFTITETYEGGPGMHGPGGDSGTAPPTGAPEDSSTT